MTTTRRPLTIVAVGLALVACTETRQPLGPSIEVKVAPINYPGISNVCYDLTVLNGEPTPDDDDPSNEPDVVWSQAGVCSGTYGNGPGGDITYIGPCDADVGQNNYVQLTLADVYAGGGSPLLDQIDTALDGDADYQNPCPTGDPCMLDFACRENEDQLVVFNLTIMRDANQGFFDIAVNFEDIFCSAKLDTCYDVTPSEIVTADFDGRTYFVYRWIDAPQGTPEWQTLGYAKHATGPEWNMYRFTSDPNGGSQSPTFWRTFGHTTDPSDPKDEVVFAISDLTVTLRLERTTGGGTPIALLHDQSGQRKHTAVLAVACTGGPTRPATEGGPVPDLTRLYMDAIVIDCGSEVFTLDPSAGPADGGNVYSATTTPPLGLATSGDVWQYAVYAGQEQLDCGDGPGSCDKVYWNLAIGIEGLPPGCTLSTAASASAGPLEHELAPGFFVPGTTPRATTYPVMRFDEIPLTDGGGVICGEYPLNDSDGKVHTDYTEVDEPHDFDFELVQLALGGVSRGALDDDDFPLTAPQFVVRANNFYVHDWNTDPFPWDETTQWGQVQVALAQSYSGKTPYLNGAVGGADRIDIVGFLFESDGQAAVFCQLEDGRTAIQMQLYRGGTMVETFTCSDTFANNTFQAKAGVSYFVVMIGASGVASYTMGGSETEELPQGVKECSESTGKCKCVQGPCEYPNTNHIRFVP